ncbi:hypothetical protein RJ55_02448 [Drechmeria coniospora]|nr:hypothetical protein RJ55_02448 [Drechmeria coniospora]
MRFARAIAAVLSAAVAHAASQNARPITGNPKGVRYTATLPEDPFFHGDFDGNVEGFITAETPDDGVGVKFTVHFENLPKSGGPFPYHIHVKPVVGGNCTQTLAHLDPFERGEKPPCASSAPETCQVGDLAGKHGMVTADPFQAEYVDKFVSLKEGDAEFMGNRSFVFHFANTTRITCANFVKMDVGAPYPSASSSVYPVPTASGATPARPAATDSTVPFVVSAASKAHTTLPFVAIAGVALLAFAG